MLESYYPYTATGNSSSCNNTRVNAVPAGGYVTLWTGSDQMYPKLNEQAMKWVSRTRGMFVGGGTKQCWRRGLESTTHPTTHPPMRPTKHLASRVRCMRA